MARTPKPWFWKERQSWFVTIRGERKNLGPDKKEAWEEFHKLMSKPARRTRLFGRISWWLSSINSLTGSKSTALKRPITGIRARYNCLPVATPSWWSTNSSHSTCNNGSIATRIWPRAPSGTMPGRSCELMAWAEEQGLVDRSPIARFKKPKAGVRQTVITPEEYTAILSLIPNETFHDLLIFAWETGARAAECLAIEKRHVDLPTHRIVFPVEEEKMQRVPRIIYLTDAAEEIVRRLILQHPSGPIFCNTNGAAWTTEAVNCAFVALQIRTGLRAMKVEGFTLSEEEIQRKIVRAQVGPQGEEESGPEDHRRSFGRKPGESSATPPHARGRRNFA